MFEYTFLITSLFSERSNRQNTVYELAKLGADNDKIKSLKYLLFLYFRKPEEFNHFDFKQNLSPRITDHGNPIIMIYKNKQIQWTGTGYFPMKDIEVNCGF
jgi:hypothetical protein